MKQSKSFEATYTRYSFAPLVTLGVMIAAAFKSDAGKANSATRGGRKALIGSERQLAA